MGSLLAALRETPTWLAQREGCPRPDKRAYPTPRAAQTARRAVTQYRPHDRSVEVYLCDCGAYHLGNPPVATS